MEKKLLSTLSIFFMFISLASGRAYGDVEQDSSSDWKLLFNRLFALEIYKEHVLPNGLERTEQEQKWDHELSKHSFYTPLTFNESIDRILEAKSSMEAYNLKNEVFAKPENRKHLREVSSEEIFSEEALKGKRLSKFISSIESMASRPIASEELFLTSPEGKSLTEALTSSLGQPENFVFVMIPGYAAHVVKDYIFEEFVNNINSYHGRCKNRPLLAENGIDFSFIGHKEFYGSDTEQYCPDENLVNHHPINRPFVDVLHPNGWELGNTLGDDRETVRLMRQWLRDLPSKYEGSNIVLLGYSKGAPVVLDILRQIRASAENARREGYSVNPKDLELIERIKGIVTFAGVVQGTNVAASAKEEIDAALDGRSIAEYIDEFKDESLESILSYVSPFFADFDFSFLNLEAFEELFEIFGLDFQSTRDTIDRLINGRELKELMEGANDLTPLKRTLWNLENYNNTNFSNDIFVMNLSAVTDISMFSRPNGYSEDPSQFKSELHPKIKLNDQGEVEMDFSSMSIDAGFLYLSSIEGFKSAPGGLFDTQVELANTKSILLDRRSLADSLPYEDLKALLKFMNQNIDRFRPHLVDEVFTDSQVNADFLFHSPRKELFKKEAVSNIKNIDLGEFRGHHWSLFVQAIKPPSQISQEFVYRDFPRQAFMRALLQVIAARHLAVLDQKEREDSHD